MERERESDGERERWRERAMERTRERERERERGLAQPPVGKIEGRFSMAGVVLDRGFALARDVTMIFISELAPIYTECAHKPQLNQSYYGELKLPSKEKEKHSS